MEHTTKSLFKGIYQIDPFLSVFILQNTNRWIGSIINEIPTTFVLMQRFEVTVIKNACFPTLLFIIFDITYTYVHSIIDFSHNTGCSRGLSFYSIYCSHTRNIFTHELFSISNIFVYFTLLGGPCMYNSILLMYFPILGAYLITASCKNYLIDKWPSASLNFDTGRK